MLTEYRQVMQERTGTGRRRWFEDDEFELIVWYRPAGGVEGFQLCYGGFNDAHALTWRDGAGFSHGSIDAGEASPLKNLTPIVEPDGAVPWADLTALFRARSATLEAPLRDLVLAKLAEGGGAC